MNRHTGNEPGEDFNVREVHGQIWRERDEPSENHKAVPWWLKHVIYAPLAIWAIWYLAYASGGFRFDVQSERFGDWQIDPVELEAIVAAGEAGADDAPDDSRRDVLTRGAAIYSRVCAACHQANGAGVPGAFPPLAESDWVGGNEERLILLTLHGLVGPILVNGEPWDGVMPGQGDSLDDNQIANVLTYIRSTWGNDAPPVDPATVSGLREKYAGHAPWTEETLYEAVGGL